MPTTYTEQTFPSTYKDDYDKTKNYHRILFNSGKALQARELTQLQSVIQAEISQLAGNLFEEGAMISPGSFRVDNKLEFIKISPQTPFPTDASVLVDQEFSTSSGIKLKVVQALPREDEANPDTLFVEYTDDSLGSETGTRVGSGETITSTDGTYVLDVQSINTNANPAVGLGSSIQVDEGHFFVQGRVVYCPAQRLVFRKYETDASSRFGFIISQDIVTVDDDQTLYDNQGETPNLTSPGADRYRIRLTLADARTTTQDKNFIPIIEVQGGQIVSTVTANSGFKSIREEMATRTYEESGDYVKRYFRANFAPNDANTFKLKITPGTAYVRGYRINKDAETTILVDKPQETLDRQNDSITIDYGNYFLYNEGKGQFDINTCELVNLHTGLGGTGSVIGQTRIRALNVLGGLGDTKKLHVFDTIITSEGNSVRDVRSIAAQSSPTARYLNIFRGGGTQTLTKMYGTEKRPLLFDAPIRRPKEFSDIQLTVAKQKGVATGDPLTTDGSGQFTLTPSAGNALSNPGSWIISNATTDYVENPTIAFTASSTTVSGLDASTAYQIMYYEKISNASQKTKTLEPTTLTTTLDSDGDGVRFINLGQTDLYEITRCSAYDSSGKSQLNLFSIDNGQRDTHYGTSKLIYGGSGLDSDEQPIFVRFKYFDHGTDGQFFGVNSYDGQVTYPKIPVHRSANGKLVSLRDVIDFRPSINSTTEEFDGDNNSHVFAVPATNSLVNADAKYYMPRLDKLVLSKGGELRYIQGVSSMMPKFPSTPVDCIDLYKIELGANTLHTKDLKTTIIPRRGYTMEDIGKLDKRVDRLEQATTLSLLELNATNERLFDSAGNERIHTGFFVDNFKNQKFTDTKSIEHRASQDPTKGLIRPSYKCKTIPMIFDSADPISTGVVQKGDNVYLEHDEVQYLAQNMASKTINVNPFHVEKTYGDLVLSPSKDTWKNFEQDAPTVIDGGTEFDTSQALLWNEAEWGWGGTDPADMQVGMQSDPLVTQTSSTTLLGESTRLVGQEVEIDHGDWVETGSNSTTTELSNATNLLSVENNTLNGGYVKETESSKVDYIGKRITKPISPKFSTGLSLNVKDEVIITFSQTYKYVFRCSAHNGRIKVYRLPSGQADVASNWTEFGTQKIQFNSGDKLMIKGVGTGGAHVYFYKTQDKWKAGTRYDVTVGRKTQSSASQTNTYQTIQNEQVTKTQDVSVQETVTNTTYERTNTISTENTYETTQEYNTATETTTSVNRISSESVLTEVVDNRELQIIHIPWMRSRKVSIRATNLRPNTRYFPFFNNTDVSRFCKMKTFYKSSTVADPNYTVADNGTNMIPEVELPPSTEHSEGSTPLQSDANGILEAEFEIPNLVNPPMRFPVGTAVFSLYDISKPDKSKSLSYCSQFYTASGVIESLSGEYTITNTRVLEIVGGQTTTVNNDRYNVQTVSTDTVVTTETQQDVKTEKTQVEVYGPVETSSVITGSTTQLVSTNTSYDYAQTAGSTAVLQGTASYSKGKTYSLPYGDPGTKKVVAPKNKIYKDEDPTAQSFEVVDPNGIFLTRLRLYFAEKPTGDDVAHPVSVAITEAPAGYPDRTRRVPGSYVSLNPSQVKQVPEADIGSMVANGTDFVFPEPIFLQGNGANYAIIIRSKSMKYKMYISEVEDFLLGSTETRITKQPTLGSLFVSQNTDVWEPRGTQDLAYVMYRADFVTQGNAFLHNRNVRPTTLVKDPIMTDSGSNEVTVFTTGHGLRKGDRTRIFGLDPDTRYNGILGSSIMNTSSPYFRTVTSVDANSIKFEADSSATVSGRVGGGTSRLLQHIPYDVIRPDFDVVQPESTNYTLSAKLTENSSLADSDVNTRMTVDSQFQLLRNKTNTTLEKSFAVMNQWEEATETTLQQNGQHSLTSQVTMTTTDTRVSPILDLEATDVKLTSNIIDNTDPNPSGQYLEGEVTNKHFYIDETHPTEGTCPAKHVTIPITLSETATGIRAMLSVNRPPGTGIQLYYRACSKDKNIRTIEWETADTLNATPADNNKNAFREYSYLIGGTEGTLEPFDKFQLKITFSSLNTAKVPVIKDLRCIALAD